MQYPLRLSVSLVTYHSPMRLMQQTLMSLRKCLAQARIAGLDLQMSVEVVDNSTRPDYREKLRRQVEQDWSRLLPEISYRYSGGNLGYGGGHNLAILEAESEFHLVLNPDVKLAESALVVALDFLRRHPDVVMVNPRATNGAGVPQYLCKRYPSILMLLLRAFAPTFLRRRLNDYMAEYELRDQGGDIAIKDVPLMSGCCMCARTSVLQRVGGFSGNFFMYFEDFDLSMRLLPVGRLVFLPGMQIIHHGGYSARKGLRHILLFTSSGWKFFNRHGWSWI